MALLTKLQKTLRSHGALGTLAVVGRTVMPERAKCLAIVKQQLAGGRGLEIGGPSQVFGRRGVLPLYDVLPALDNCNFAAETTWEGQIEAGQTYQYSRKHPPGRQLVGEAGALHSLVAGAYDFLLSSHVIEHLANPLAALLNWQAVLKPGGTLVLLVPHREGTFDHRRPVTTLEHLRQDHADQTGEDDLTHLPEILALHDLERDPGAGSYEEFAARSRQNVSNRCLHQHVFNGALVAQMLDECGYQIDTMQCMQPFHVVATARRLDGPAARDNSAFLAPDAAFLGTSPFLSDRQAA